MKTITLNANVRERIGKQGSKQIRREGAIPGVVYGGDKDPLSIKVDKKEFGKLLKDNYGDNIFIQLDIDGDTKGEEITILKDNQFDPMSDDMTHLDFQRIVFGETAVFEVPLHIANRSDCKPITDGKALLNISLDSFEVECLPKDIPQSIDVDVANMQIGDSITVKDLSVDSAVTVRTDEDIVVCSLVHAGEKEVVESDEDEADAEAETQETSEAPKAEDSGKESSDS